MPYFRPEMPGGILVPRSGRAAHALGILMMATALLMACTGESAPPGKEVSASPTNGLSPVPSMEITPPHPSPEARESPEPTATGIPMDEEIAAALGSGKPVLIFFYSGCAPCKYRSQVTVLDQLETIYAGRVVILRIRDAEPAAEFGVTVFPALILLTGTPDGQYTIFWRLEGTADRATLENVLQEALKETIAPGPSPGDQNSGKEPTP